jgi:aubergine-like protein
MPFPRREIYSVIKTVCCSERPIPSQVVLSKTLADIGNLTLTVKNLAMQINCKLGGSPWGLYIPLVI